LLWRLTLVDIVEPEYSEKGGQDRHPIGTGPYKFVQYTPRQNFIMERNEDYWGEQPYFDRVEARILPEDATRLAALLAGEVQMINAVSPEMIAQIEENADTTTVSGTTGRLIYAAMRNEREPFDDVRVRQAVNYAIDREAITETILEGIAIVINAPLPKTLQCALDDLEYPYDPDKAKELLEEAGYAGEEIKFAVPRGRYPNDGQVGEAIAGYLQDVGLNVTYEQGDYASVQPLIRQGLDSPYDMAFQGWSADALDPVLMALYLFHSDNTASRSSYANPEVDELLDAANAETDMEKVCELLAEAQTIVWEDAPFAFLYTPVENLGISSNLKGFTTHPFEIYLFNDAYME
jgi:peptide/nickel transport system substrate-binding protein